MFNYKQFNILSFFFIAVLSVFYYWFSIPIFFIFIIPLIYLSIITYACLNIDSNFFLNAICSAKTNSRNISLSFDDGPSNSYTPEILDILYKHKIKATFFLIGKNISGNEHIVKRIISEGHIIGNHSYSHHHFFDLFGYNKIKQDLEMADNEINRAAGVIPKLFRPPYGVTNPIISKVVIYKKYSVIGWNARSFDTAIKDERNLLNKVKKKLRPGAIFLFHDTSKSTLNILSKFIEEVEAKKFKIIPLDQLINIKPYA